ncbi:MAG: iron ABC transporter permease [Methanomethylophilus sp.]|nr:iron ABC transporter permease [Methanomethylophilus sp.]
MGTAEAPSERPPTASRMIEGFRRSRSRKIIFIAVLAVLIAVIAVLSATVGSYSISASEVYGIIWDQITGGTPSDTVKQHIVIDLRLPRIFAAIIAGFALAVCGVAMQSMMKNPLADPYTMGISSGAGFGAALAIILGFEMVSGGGIVINAFIFAVIPSLVIVLLSRIRSPSPTMMILCGISLMYMFNALTQLFMLLSDPDDLASVYTWLVGSVDGIDYSELMIIFLVALDGCFVVQYFANQLNVMGIGDERARTLGINVDRQRLIILLVITLVAAAVVSFTGVIGFVGLVAPHICRLIIGADNRYLIPASGCMGALLLLVSDIIAKTIVAPTMLPVGVIMSCIGGPVFIILILRRNREVWASERTALWPWMKPLTVET